MQLVKNEILNFTRIKIACLQIDLVVRFDGIYIDQSEHTFFRK